MRSTKESITLPLLRSRGEVLMLGWMLLPMGLVLALTLVLEPMNPLGIVINGLMALGLTAAGAALILACSLRLHLVPEGAAVSLFGRTLARYPAKGLTVIRWDQDQLNGPPAGPSCLEFPVPGGAGSAPGAEAPFQRLLCFRRGPAETAF